jgi:hypothetical protein
VGRGQHPQIDSDRSRAAERHHLFFLQHSQQQGLSGGRQVAELVQQERAPIGAANEAELVTRRAGECALRVPEQLTFDEAGRERAAIDSHEGAGPSGSVMDRSRQPLLARARGAQEQQRELRARGLLDVRERGGERGQQRSEAPRSAERGVLRVEDLGRVRRCR